MKHFLTVVAAMCLAATVNAQQPAQTKPQPAPTPARPVQQQPPIGVGAPIAQAIDPINIRFEIRIRDTGAGAQAPKVVAMTGTLYEVSLIRAGNARNNDSPLNVDVNPSAIRDDKVLTKLGIEYTPQVPPVAPGTPPLPTLTVRQNVNVWLESGKPMVISESADPRSDRRLTVEVTATIIR